MVLIIYVNGLPKRNDKHPFQSKQISHSGVVNFEQDGYVQILQTLKKLLILNYEN